MLDQFGFEYPDFAKTSGVKTALIVNDKLGTWQSYAWIDGKNYVYIRQPGVIDDLSVPIKAARDTWNELMRSGFRVEHKGFSL